MAPGGKGANQAAAAAKAGAEVAFVGHVGADAYGPVVRGLLLEAGVGCDLLAVATAPTAIAVIGVDAGGENAIIVASGANLETAAAQVPDAMLGAGATVLCQNEIRPAETFAVLTRAKRLGARTVLNMAPAASVPPEVLGALDVLVVNEHRGRDRGRRHRAAARDRRPRARHHLRPHLRRHPGRGRLHRRHRGRGLARAGAADHARSTPPAPATPSSACSPPGWTAAPTWSMPCAPPASPPPAAASRSAPRPPSRSGRPILARLPELPPVTAL